MSETSVARNYYEYVSQCEQFMMNFRKENSRFIAQYVRNPNDNSKRGVIVAFLSPTGELRVGWSMYRIGKEINPFNTSVALRKAINRSQSVDQIKMDEVATKAKPILKVVIERAQRIFLGIGRTEESAKS